MRHDLFRRVYDLLPRVPPGRVVTYGQIAQAIGLPHGARVVGWAMRACPEGLPWHRVVNARGGVSTCGGPENVPIQRTLLEEEGVEFDLYGRIDLGRFRWDGA
jgi:methylated-DNA-protein-cysteine methyltransferase-like protein